MTDQSAAAVSQDAAAQIPVPQAPMVYTPVHQGWVPPTASYAPPPIPAQTRYTPPAPLGIGSQIDGVHLAELGAILGAMGAEKGAATAILHTMQATTIKAFVEVLPGLLDQIMNLNKARLNLLMQQVQALPEVGAPATGFLARLAGPVSTGFISKATVLQLIAVAMERPTQTT